jgi:hypothetical protein
LSLFLPSHPGDNFTILQPDWLYCSMFLHLYTGTDPSAAWHSFWTVQTWNDGKQVMTYAMHHPRSMKASTTHWWEPKISLCTLMNILQQVLEFCLSK